MIATVSLSCRMWKFEGLQWHLNFFGVPQARYTESHTLVERVTTSAPFEQVRADMALAISRTKNNDKDFEDWPLGLDMPPTLSAMAMSGSVWSHSHHMLVGHLRRRNSRAVRNLSVWKCPRQRREVILASDRLRDRHRCGRNNTSSFPSTGEIAR